MRELWRFPNPVNEVAARTVAAGVALTAAATIVLSATAGTSWLWLTVSLAYGFVARVAAGPRLSPLAQLATRVIAPALGHEKLVAGPPKRFAQSMGAAISLGAVVAYCGFGSSLAAQILLGLIVAAAVLESVFALCIGCIVFAQLMKLGLVPAQTCEACANVALRYSPAT